jgi:hypothetical protein
MEKIVKAKSKEVRKMSERDFRERLLGELDQIRKLVGAIKENTDDIRQRVANLETSKLE